MAPDIPTAMYNSGATTLPVYPTYRSFETNPASTAAREAPIAVSPNTFAKFSKSLKFSPFFKPRPPDTTLLALVRSGLSDLMTSCFKILTFGSENLALKLSKFFISLTSV
jgi:hypothetical protein